MMVKYVKQRKTAWMQAVPEGEIGVKEIFLKAYLYSNKKYLVKRRDLFRRERKELVNWCPDVDEKGRWPGGGKGLGQMHGWCVSSHDGEGPGCGYRLGSTGWGELFSSPGFCFLSETEARSSVESEHGQEGLEVEEGGPDVPSKRTGEIVY